VLERNKVKVVHLTSAHPRYDTRIFFKECRSLVSNGFKVGLVVADGLPDERKYSIDIYGVEKAQGRLDRMLNASKRVYEKACELDADIYHLHDPELLPIGLKLKRRGKKVIFDSHEDLPVQLLNKSYSRKWVLKILSRVSAIYETYVCRRLDGVVAATPFIEEKFKKINPRSVAVNNYPLASELKCAESRNGEARDVCYVGGLAKVRGVFETIEALNYFPEETGLIVAGRFESEDLERKVQGLDGWKKAEFLGFVGRKEVSEIYQRSIAGLVTLHPIPNYLDALPVKMFEYMGAGIPVIASNIPLWKKIVEESDCGITVDPMDPKEIARAVAFFVANPAEATRMGANGRKAVLEKYNWDNEQAELIALYEGVDGA